MILSSLRSRRALSFLQKVVGSGCPRGGWHSRVAVSPTATTVFCGFCLKSSRSTSKKENKKWINFYKFKAEGLRYSDLEYNLFIWSRSIIWTRKPFRDGAIWIIIPLPPFFYRGSEEPKQSQFLIKQFRPWRGPFWISRAKSMRM